jgi:hypothetical protein
MLQSEFDEITVFAANLVQLRQQVNDQQLLDRCQKFLSDLVGLVNYANAPLEPDPAPEPTPDED